MESSALLTYSFHNFKKLGFSGSPERPSFLLFGESVRQDRHRQVGLIHGRIGSSPPEISIMLPVMKSESL